MSAKNTLRKWALRALPDSDRIRYLANRGALETWTGERARTCPVFDDRLRMYDYINSEILKDAAIQYLEFGVFQGESIRYFSEINSSADSTFMGFDTFQGLPEDWVELTRTVKSSTFSVDGKIPEIDDARVSFVPGLFQDTLPDTLAGLPTPNQLVIHNDSDLYSATLYVLTLAHTRILPGTVIIFDEFYSVMDEFRALDDYCSAYMRDYEVLATTERQVQVAIRMK
jgi:O-methyltransferase